MRFEVFIPAEDESGLDITLKIEAPNWMAALKGGLGRLGDPGAELRNVVCDVQADNSILVSDPSGTRAFRIRELEDTSVGPTPEDPSSLTVPDLSTAAVAAREAASRGARTEPDLEAAAQAAQQEAHDELRRREEEARQRNQEERSRREAELAADAAQRRRRLEEAAQEHAAQEAARRRREEEAEQRQRDATARHEAALEAQRREAALEAAQEAQRQAVLEAQQKAREDARRNAEEARRKLDAQRRMADEAQRTSPTTPEITILSEKSSRHDQVTASAIREAIAARTESDDEVLARVFEEMMDLDLEAPPIPGAAKFALSLALRHIDAESGSVLLADLSTGELSFADAQGPKADEVKRFRIQMGQGIAGFVALEGLTLRVAEAARDPRFYRKISERLGYETRSILCAPMLHEGRSFGCLELINRRGRPQFGSGDASALSYIATKLAEYLAPRVGFEA